MPRAPRYCLYDGRAYFQMCDWRALTCRLPPPNREDVTMTHPTTLSRSIPNAAGNVLGYVVMVGTNALANILPINGQNTGEISDQYASMFTPAGFTFSIWGVIYLGLLLFVIVQALPRFRHSEVLARIDRPFQVNCLLNAGWILAWHYNLLLLSMAIMLGILATLIIIHRTLADETAPVGPVFWASVRLPMGIYFGWICMATIANISILQSAWGLNDALLPEMVWTLLKLGVAAIVGFLVYRSSRDAAFIGVIAWAAYGIQANQPDGSVIGVVAMALSAVCVLGVVAHIVMRAVGARYSQTT